ncbi:MAG: 4,5-DOPA dioxygenase extradiol [bacterium]|nr:4,5-DOPA dioxygenase extradiol [bacterium]
MNLRHFVKLATEFPATARLPVLFVGHGSPVNAIEDNEFTRAWESEGENLPKPAAVLCISAHWFVDGTFVHGAKRPQTIHDFYGFSPELYAVRYDCPGAPAVAREVQGIVTTAKVQWDTDWGLDHGCWVVIKRLFPEADVPVFQMSLDATKPPQFHYDLARELHALRRQGVLIIGSGNIVHNLWLITYDETAPPYDWAIEFDEVTKKLITAGDHRALIDYKKMGHAAHLSIPTPDHYWPLLYTLALQEKDEQAYFFVEGLTYKSISMRSVVIR